MKIKKALITAAGFGSRFLPITKTFPKEMLPILNKPIIQYLIDECVASGIEEIIIVAGASDIDKFEDYFFNKVEEIKNLMFAQKKEERWQKVADVLNLKGIKIIPQNETLPYGNGRPVLTAKEYLKDEEAFVVMFGDDMVISEIPAVKQLINYFNANECDGLMGVQRMPMEEVCKYGVIEIKEGTENQVKKVIEKPKIEESPSDLCTYGRFIMTPKIFNYLSAENTGKDGELWLQDANDKLAHDGKVLFNHIDGQWVTTGDPYTYLETFLRYAMKDNEIKSKLENFIKTELI